MWWNVNDFAGGGWWAANEAAPPAVPGYLLLENGTDTLAAENSDLLITE